MKTMSAALKAHYALGTTTLAVCWKATLTNGTVVAATSHDQNIVFDSVTYLASAAYSASDVESNSELAVDNLELEGFLASPHITEDDIHTGRWDYAAIEIFEVNYADLTQGRNLLRKGTLGEVSAGRSTFRAELRGLMQSLSRRIIRLTTKDCTHNLGDARCGVNLATWTVTGSVTSVTSNRQFTDTSKTQGNDYFTGGELTFTSGLNNGLSMEVKDFAGGVFYLHEFMPKNVVAGDTYSVHRGCQKRFDEDCGTKFNNKTNFGGFPHLPGSRVFARPQR